MTAASPPPVLHLRREDADDGDLVRIGTDAHPDWLGPGSIDLVDGVTLAVDVVDGSTATLQIRATDAVSVRSDGGFADVACGVRFEPARRRPDGHPAGLRAFGHQYTEFGLPTQAGEALDRWFLLPFRPSVVLPMWLCDPDGATLLVAPLDSFHEQVITVPTADSTDTRIVWGWHGDLDEVPAGFTSTLAVLAGDSPRDLLTRWAAMLDVAPRRPVDHDALGRSVSYWTDNGAAYWYRTEAPRSVTETLRDAVISVEEAGVPVGSLQLNSWFYPHETTRPFDTDEWVVPPSGLLDWAPRSDILPEGLEPIRDAVGGRPLITHCRHLSKQSPLVDRFDCWVDEEYAHPSGDDYYEEFLDRAASWGVETFEHDWLVECFLGVRGLRAAPGRARAWQEGIDRAAAKRSMTLQWCMATPADFFQTATLGQVTSIRTSGDHGYLVGPGFLWAWFCYTNALARALGLAPFKDVFSSGGDHAEVEALLSALSTGPVGVGDAIGTTDGDVVRATCRADGTIIRPDVPIAAVDACFRRHAVAQSVPLVAETHTDHAAGRWTQVFCANTYRADEPISGTIDLGPAWPTSAVVALDLRTGAVHHPETGWDIALEPAQWTHHLLAPRLDGLAVFGDVSKHAPVGRARIASVDRVDGAVSISVVGDGETVTVDGWADHPVVTTVDGSPAEARQRDDRWQVDVVGGSTIVVR
ncbi:hypothetical protein [Actinospongicola halichondriae]|uniref:hypothetical protein n=1 Tax=Actinospongicola halichondriae TaxID=3236844 RepID=UPI003D518782